MKTHFSRASAKKATGSSGLVFAQSTRTSVRVEPRVVCHWEYCHSEDYHCHCHWEDCQTTLHVWIKILIQPASNRLPDLVFLPLFFHKPRTFDEVQNRREAVVQIWLASFSPCSEVMTIRGHRPSPLTTISTRCALALHTRGFFWGVNLDVKNYAGANKLFDNCKVVSGPACTVEQWRYYWSHN